MSEDLSTLIAAVEQADSATALVGAVRALAMAEHVEAIPTLIEVLGYNNPGAAVAAVDGLVRLDQAAVPALLAHLDGYNYGARAWAIRALALIGDPRALGVLVEAASQDFALSVRRAAAKGLGSLRWQELPPEQIAPAQTQAFNILLQGCNDPEWVVRYAAIVGLQCLATDLGTPDLPLSPVKKLQQQLQHLSRQDESPAVQARAQLALDHLTSTPSPLVGPHGGQ
ncbi:Phycocyanobilin lyase subunit beta [Halomicronema hongdechloris C2206]|uniref:Phycocyanobilin lyase subunit beta n=1 Tax=Halomicronema hongdechloris C2206 TaxID=1641165 RepID=A0A1V8NP17_9CYAN|nr:HEAT repeat domain-containing protein [Halomicronema hongdechloris]ASC70691.1 Phycocyanobilin lyase subunit beta [Halomicronema hongdechloris C2206]